MKIKLNEHDALIVVDVQNGFLPGGALGVPDGDQIIPIIEKYIERFAREKGLVLCSRDWHPENHCSFKENGGPWPKHCVSNTRGAKFAEALEKIGIDGGVSLISKGQDVSKEAYSAFEGIHVTTGKTLAKFLQNSSIKNVFICGLATDYCVLATVKDAIRYEFNTYFLADAMRAVNLKPGDGEYAVNTMLCYGATMITLENIA